MTMKMNTFNTKTYKLILIAAMGMFSAASHAAIYECKVNGETVYTSSSGPNCKGAKLQSIGSYSTNHSAPKAAPTARPKTQQAPARKNVATNNNNTNTQISSATQQQRDNSRSSILESELANEKKALANAEKALTEGRAMRLGNEKNYVKYQERVQGLEQAVQERKQNIQAIQKELNRM